jgi:galactose mutarotase-like enzyme
MSRAAALILTLCMAGMCPVQQLAADENLIALDNGAGIRAAIAPEHGGELTSLSIQFDGHWHELLYRAMDYSTRPGWRGKAPLLWPATGISVHPDAGIHHYELNGEQYPMPFHGFARNQSWRVLEHPAPDEPVSLLLEISDTEATRESYPFGFRLQVEYRLDDEKLSLVYKLRADDANTGPMPFSIGNHITFNAPLINGGEADQVRFHSELPDMLLRKPDKTFSGEVVPSPYRGWHNLEVLPQRNAISLGGTAGPVELLILDPSGLQLRLRHQASDEPSEPAVYFNLWADSAKGFFSPEPWLGTQNSLNSGAGLVELMPGETWRWQIDIIPSQAPVPGEISTEG